LAKVAGRLATKGARGIFGKAVKDLFRLSRKNVKKEVHYLRPTREAKARAARYGLPKGRAGVRGPHVKSSKIPAGSSDLAKATEDARRINKYKGGKNYAAYRYIGKDGQERILVSSSDGTHSERMGGAWLKEQMEKGNVLGVSEVYTERSPCQPDTGYCDEWLYHHFARDNPDFRVTHSHDYGINGTSKGQANTAVKNHARSLF
jgi:Xanthomonas XOO_2897-like deaminase